MLIHVYKVAFIKAARYSDFSDFSQLFKKVICSRDSSRLIFSIHREYIFRKVSKKYDFVAATTTNHIKPQILSSLAADFCGKNEIKTYALIFWRERKKRRKTGRKCTIHS